MNSKADEAGKQIRNVHFALVTTSLVLAVAASVAPDAIIGDALDELHDVRLLRSYLTTDISGEDLLAKSSQLRLTWDQLSNDGSAKIAICAKMPEALFTADLSPDDLILPVQHLVREPLQATAEGSEEEITLDQMIVAWSILRTSAHRVIVEIHFEDAILHYADWVEHLEDLRAWEPELDVWDATSPAECGDIIFSDSHIYFDGKDIYQLFLQDDGGIIGAMIPAEVEQQEIDILPMILESLPINIRDNFVLRNRAFDRAFPNLDSLAEGLENLTLSDLDAYMRRLQEERGAQVTIFGATIPIAGITNWGLILLCTIQLYFFVHLRNIGNRIPYDFPWVGAYRKDWLAQFVLFSSASALPIFSAFMLAFHGMPIGFWETSLVATLTVVSCLIGICTLRCGSQIRFVKGDE